ncbi:unnamed protein product [Adineta steineri]|uniref:Death domain-containing protein n=1 Tax=Adineta steineri TaxID=433720 RepID=A0A815MLA9_9BILA|nr:unnamed protein product [Adineta steineri]CAF3755239.1 unnamed protein product [Adineta steineri]
MPARPASGKKGGKDDKKGKKGAVKTGVADPNQERIDGLIREREEIRSKLNLVCSKIMENVNMDDFKNDYDSTKQQPSDIPIDTIYSMVDQICYYRVAFLNLFQEADDNKNVSVHKKITQLSNDDPDLFRQHLTPYQRLTFTIRERDTWKENAHLLQEIFGNLKNNQIFFFLLVDQLEMETLQKSKTKAEDILKTHQLNLEDICFIFSLPRILSINEAQKLRAKKPVHDSRDQQATVDQQENTDDTNISSNDMALKSQSSNQNSTSERRNQHSASMKRNVSFADEVNVRNDDDKTDFNPNNELPSTVMSHEQTGEDNFSSISLGNSPSLTFSDRNSTEEKINDSDYHSISSASSHHHQHQQQQYDAPSQSTKYNLPSKYRLPLASEVTVNKMDPNLRMLIIKELSRSGHVERPLSRMSSARPINTQNVKVNSRQQQRQQIENVPVTISPEWVELARLVGVDEPEIDHWLSQNLQYPAGRVISAWCNSSSTPTVAKLHSLLTSNELNRHDLARYIETMYIIE